MCNIINIFNELLCALNEIVWPASSFFMWMVSIMYVYKKKGRRNEYALALFVISFFVTYVTFCFYQRKTIGVSIPLSVGLICGTLFYFDKKKPKNIDETGMENVSTDTNTNTKEEILGKKKKGRSIDKRTIYDFVKKKDNLDETAYIQQLKDMMKGRKGQKALEECILPELGKSISKDITFRAFNDAFPNVIDEPGFSRFKSKIPKDITLQKL